MNHSSDQVWGWFTRNVETEFDKLDPRTGRFMECSIEGGNTSSNSSGNTGGNADSNTNSQGGAGCKENGGEAGVERGWAVTHQDIMLCMAVLYTSRRSGNLYRDASLLKKIAMAGDALRRFQYPDGKVEFVKADGSKWGPIYMPWSMYHWLETYRLIAPELDDRREADWRDGLNLAFEGMHREMRHALDTRAERASVVHNIPTWNAMSLHRASAVLGNPGWKRTADTMIRLTLKEQDADGFWPEHHGPTTLYNLVYIHALGLYARHGGDIDVMPALDRALAFHERFTYPDGSKVETVDGRTKYARFPSPMGLTGFTLLPRGAAYAQSLIDLAMREGAAWKAPHMADLLQYWSPGSATVTAADSSTGADQTADGKTVTAVDRSTLFDRPVIEAEAARSIVIKREGWFVCLSAYTAPQVESRWGQDRQSFIGVWQRDSGLIVGGGNSKNQPEWSTFEVRPAEGGHFYVPREGAPDIRNRQIRLTCGPRTLTVRLRDMTAEGIRLDFAADIVDGDEALAHIPLQLQTGLPLTADEAGHASLVNERPIRLRQAQGSHLIRHAGWQLRFDGSYDLRWPSHPFNPYAADGSAKLDEAVALLTLPLKAGETRQLFIDVAASDSASN